jgi:hypothetical protein
VLTIPAEEVTPAGSGVGELGTSVRDPPLTANTDTKCMPEPSTSRYLPSGESRASMSAPPPLMGVLHDPFLRLTVTAAATDGQAVKFSDAFAVVLFKRTGVGSRTTAP